MPEIVEPKILDLCAIDGTIERILDVGDGSAFKLSLQVNKYVLLRPGLPPNLLQLLYRRVIQRQIVWTAALRAALDTNDPPFEIDQVPA